MTRLDQVQESQAAPPDKQKTVIKQLRCHSASERGFSRNKAVIITCTMISPTWLLHVYEGRVPRREEKSAAPHARLHAIVVTGVRITFST